MTYQDVFKSNAIQLGNGVKVKTRRQTFIIAGVKLSDQAPSYLVAEYRKDSNGNLEGIH